VFNEATELYYTQRKEILTLIPTFRNDNNQWGDWGGAPPLESALPLQFSRQTVGDTADSADLPREVYQCTS